MNQSLIHFKKIFTVSHLTLTLLGTCTRPTQLEADPHGKKQILVLSTDYTVSRENILCCLMCMADIQTSFVKENEYCCCGCGGETISSLCSTNGESFGASRRKFLNFFLSLGERRKGSRIEHTHTHTLSLSLPLVLECKFKYVCKASFNT